MRDALDNFAMFFGPQRTKSLKPPRLWESASRNSVIASPASWKAAR